MLARIAMAVFALLVAAALAVQLRGHDLLAAGTNAAGPPTHRPNADRIRSALDDFDRATGLRPGTDALVAAAELELRAGHYADAARYSARATRREDRNFSAWVLLGAARRAAGSAAAAQTALARAHALNPLYRLPR